MPIAHPGTDRTYFDALHDSSSYDSTKPYVRISREWEKTARRVRDADLATPPDNSALRRLLFSSESGILYA